MVRVPRVVPISEEEPDLGDGWKLREWENLDVFGYQRTYSEVARGFVDGKDPPNKAGCPRIASNGAEDDPWEYL